MADIIKYKDIDPKNITDRVSVRIKDTVVDLLSEEEWNALIAKTIEDFLTDKHNGYGNNDKIPSQFKQLVFKVLNDFISQKITEVLNKEWVDHNYNDTVSEKVKETLVSNGNRILTKMIEGMMQSAVNSMSYITPPRF